MRYSWLDIALYLTVLVLLCPLVARLVETVIAALDGGSP